MTRMWIERRERDNGAPVGHPERRVHAVLFCVMEEGEYWRGMAKTEENRRPVIEAEFWPGDGRREAQVSWPSTSDKRPELAFMLAHALQFAALEAATGECGKVFADGGRFEPEPAFAAVLS